MQLKQFTIDFQNIGQQEFLRPNVGYRYFFDVQKGEIYPSKQNIKLKYVLKEIPAKKVFKGELGDSEILVDIGNIERRFNNLTNLKEVSEVGSDKSILRDGDIVIPKMQPQIGNIFLNLEHNKYVGSTELLEYSISENTNPLFLYYLITSKKFLSDLDKQEEMNQKIEAEGNKIDEIIEKAIFNLKKKLTDEGPFEVSENIGRLKKTKRSITGRNGGILRC